MSSKKIYPRLIKDENGLKFHFDNGNSHYTLRFAGNPLLLLEYLYIQRGGVDFQNAYNAAKDGTKHK